MHVCDIAHEHGLPAHLFDRKLIDGGDRVRAGVHRQRIVFRPDLDVAGGQNDVLLLNRRGHIRRRERARGKRLLVEVDHNDARLAAVGVRNFGAVDNRQIGPNDVLAKIVQLGIRQ
jgi:hypothetical protein